MHTIDKLRRAFRFLDQTQKQALDQTPRVINRSLARNHTTMPSGAFNLKKMIQKKKIPKKLPELKESTLVLPPNVIENRIQAKHKKKEKLAEKRLDDIKRYKRSLDRIWIARYIESNRGIPFMQICEGMESKNSQVSKIVKEVKQELVDAKFGVEEQEEEFEDDE